MALSCRPQPRPKGSSRCSLPYKSEQPGFTAAIRWCGPIPTLARKELRHAIRHGDYLAPQLIRKDLPPDLTQILVLALHRAVRSSDLQAAPTSVRNHPVRHAEDTDRLGASCATRGQATRTERRFDGRLNKTTRRQHDPVSKSIARRAASRSFSRLGSSGWPDRREIE